MRLQKSKDDEFERIKEKTRILFEKPKKKREPFLKNLFLKKIDPVKCSYGFFLEQN